ncbi:MAG: AAA family ATPase [Rhodospirillaceae bacterium]|nr:AAA family ATPase [Rhodospirillaceae bacterium]
MKNGLLIALVGADNVGKTTIIKALQALRLGWVYSKEPYLDARVSDPLQRPDERLRLSTADRHRHYREVIDPALAQCQIVVIDRCMACAAAYQATTAGEAQTIFAKQVAAFRKPDFFFFVRCGAAAWQRRGPLPPDAVHADRLYASLIIRGDMRPTLVLDGNNDVNTNASLVAATIEALALPVGASA